MVFLFFGGKGCLGGGGELILDPPTGFLISNLPKHSISPGSCPVVYVLPQSQGAHHAFLLDSLASLAPACCVPVQKFLEAFMLYKALISLPASEGLTGQFGLTLLYQRSPS